MQAYVEASSGFCVSAHRLPCMALVNFSQWYGFKEDFLVWDWFLGADRNSSFPLDPMGGAGVGGIFPGPLAEWFCEVALENGASGGGTGGPCWESLDVDLFGGKLGGGGGAGVGPDEAAWFKEELEFSGGGGGGGGLIAVTELFSGTLEEIAPLDEEVPEEGGMVGGTADKDSMCEDGVLEEHEAGGRGGGGGGGGRNRSDIFTAGLETGPGSWLWDGGGGG